MKKKLTKFLKKYEIKAHIKDWTTISEDISKLTTKNMVTNQMKEAFNFEKGLVEYFNPKNTSLNTADGLLIEGNNIIFIEFKQDVVEGRSDLKFKALESPLELAKIFKKEKIINSVNDMKGFNFYFVLVYSKKNVQLEEATTIQKLLPTKQALFEIERDLKAYEGVLYEKVLILSNEKFEEVFLNELTNKKGRSIWFKILMTLIVATPIILGIVYFTLNYLK